MVKRTNRKTKKFALTKRLINPKEIRDGGGGGASKKKKKGDGARKGKGNDENNTKRFVEKASYSLFNQHNFSLKPPYDVLVDTNFINFSIKNKIDLVRGMMDCLYARCHPCVTDCVVAELEKLGQKYRVALRIAKDPRFVRLPCMHKGTYADDCIVERCRKHRCYVVATNDTDLKRRLRKIPGVPIMYVANHKYSVERLPEAGNIGNAPRW